MNSPNAGIPFVPENTMDPAAGLNLSIDVLDVLVQTKVIAKNLTAPPGSPTDGDLYIVDGPATGAWAGNENNVARYVAEGDFWRFYVAGEQVNIVQNQDDGALYVFDNSSSPGAWVFAIGGANLTVQNDDSPPDAVVNVATLIFPGAIVTELDTGVAQVVVVAAGSITVQNDDSPPDEVLNAATVVFEGATVTEDPAGTARVSFPTSSGGGNVTPDTHPGSPDALDDEFEAAFSGWTWRNQGAATAVNANGSLVLTAPANNVQVEFRVVERNLPGGNWRFRAKLAADFARANFFGGGVILVNSGNDRIITFGTSDAPQTEVYERNNVTAPATNTNVFTSTDAHLGNIWLPRYYEIEYDGTNYIFRLSTTGVDGSFFTLVSRAAATYLGAADKIGFYTYLLHPTDTSRVVVDWFRRMA